MAAEFLVKKISGANIRALITRKKTSSKQLAHLHQSASVGDELTKRSDVARSTPDEVASEQRQASRVYKSSQSSEAIRLIASTCLAPVVRSASEIGTQVSLESVVSADLHMIDADSVKQQRAGDTAKQVVMADKPIRPNSASAAQASDCNEHQILMTARGADKQAGGDDEHRSMMDAVRLNWQNPDAGSDIGGATAACSLAGEESTRSCGLAAKR